MRNGNRLYLFPSDSLEVLKIDVTFEAGAGYQPQLLCASTANQLLLEGTHRRSAKEIAEFFDFRGIAVDRDVDGNIATLTLYTLRKYALEVIDLLYEIVTEAAFPDEECNLLMQKRQQQLSANFQKTSYVARVRCSEALYGAQHPMGMFARPEDAAKLRAETVRAFYAERCPVGAVSLILSGSVDQEVVNHVDALFGAVPAVHLSRETFVATPGGAGKKQRFTVPGAVQSSLRIGRLLPIRWDDADYGRLMVLNHILGGYFGSRLMSNVREDKGYTYGIDSQCHLNRGNATMTIRSDVNGEAEQPALREVYHEMERLCQEPVSGEELDRVRSSLMGDFLRSIDGIFERSERFRVMMAADVDERFRDNQLEAIRSVTPAQLQDLAQRFLRPEDWVETVVGA